MCPPHPRMVLTFTPARKIQQLLCSVSAQRCLLDSASQIFQAAGIVDWIVSSRNSNAGASLVVQWLVIYLSMQETWVRSLVWEDTTCHGETKPMHHKDWAWALEPVIGNFWTHTPQLLKSKFPGAHAPQQEKPPQWESHAPQLESSPRSLQLEKAHRPQWRPSTAKNK